MEVIHTPPESVFMTAELDTEFSESIADRMKLVVMGKEEGMNERNVKAKIAEICDATPQTVHLWFGEKVKAPSIAFVARFAQHYHVDLMWLATGDKATCENAVESNPDEERLSVHEAAQLGNVSSISYGRERLLR